MKNVKIPFKRVQAYFSPGTTPQQAEAVILKALKLYNDMVLAPQRKTERELDEELEP